MQNTAKKNRLKRFADKPGLGGRWKRYAAFRITKDFGRYLARAKVRRYYKKNQKELIRTHEEILRRYRLAEKFNQKHSLAVYKVLLFLLAANRDLASIKVDVLTSRDWWLRKLLARHIALIMYELDLSKVAGKNFRKAINYFAPPKKLRQRLANNLKAVRKIHSELHDEFYEIRNKTIAHRDADVMGQYNLICNLDEIKIVSRAGDYFKTLDPLLRDLIDITLITADMGHVMNQYTGKKKFNNRSNRLVS